VLDECARHAIAFVPWGPLGSNETLDAGPVEEVVARHGATRSQVQLAWVLAQGTHVLLIPGTSSRTHLAENLAAGQLVLTETDLTQLNSVPEATATRQ
jgi:diketogulonate reductase-like aldo/keto reductase